MPDVPLSAAVQRGTLTCRHCATPFRASAGEQEFCCSGCRYVFHLLHERGLEDFYRYGETKAPVGASVFHERDFAWLRTLQEVADRADGAVTLQVQGISCAGCVWLLEAVFAEQPGAIGAEVNSSSGTIRLRWQPGECDLVSYARDVQRFGYLLGAPGTKPAQTIRPLVRKLGLCGALALNAMLFALPRYLGLAPGADYAALFEGIAVFLATASMAIGGSYFFQRAFAALRRGELHIDLPISLGLAVAYGGSLLAWATGHHAFAYFDFVSIFTFLMLLGRWLQERAVESNRNRLLGIKLSPENVRVLRNGLEVEAAADSLVAGERFTVTRGQLVPVRSRLVTGPGVFAFNWITGEPAPRTMAAGSIVASGARVVSADTLDFVALEGWATCQLAALLSLDASGPWRNRGLQKLIRVYLGVVLVLAVLGFAGWATMGGGWLAACQVLVSVLVVSCPCAIGVALPLLDDVAAARLQQFGVYLREASLWQRLPRVRHLLFDKTGTLTLETLVPANPEAIEALTPHEKSLLLRLTLDSLHPVSACLREVLLPAGVVPAPASGDGVREETGHGLEWACEGAVWRLGRATWAAPDSGGEGTVFSRDGHPVAAFRFREEIRPDAAAQVADLVGRGFDITLLSGDEPARVQAIAKTLGLPADCALGGLTPDGKADLVRTRWAASSLMLGDGANDSLAFDAALCRGTPAADSGLLEHKADFYLLGRSLSGLGELFAMSRRHKRAGRAVMGFALTYNAVAVTASLAGLMSPLVAAIIMPLSSLVSIALVFAFLKNPTHPQST